jgi:pimeloyl-ACP methyl ester carboxylesterase
MPLPPDAPPAVAADASDARASDTSASDAAHAGAYDRAAYGPGLLHRETFGPEDAAGLPVVVLHGWGSRVEHVRGLAKGLARAGADAPARYVVAVDLPGHGASPAPPVPWGVPEHAALVHDLMCEIREATGAARVALVGHSNGGRIALFMASRAPYAQGIDRLVLVAPSGITPPRGLATRLKSGLAKALKAPFAALPPPLKEPALDWLRHSLAWKALGSADYNALAGVMRATFVKTVTHHLDDEVARIDVPVLVFWGTEDTAIRRPQVEALEARIPDAGLVTLDGAGHYAHLDAPATVVAATRRFLSDAKG